MLWEHREESNQLPGNVREGFSEEKTILEGAAGVRQMEKRKKGIKVEG